MMVVIFIKLFKEGVLTNSIGGVSLVTQYRKLRWNLVRIFTILAPVEVPHALAPQYFPTSRRPRQSAVRSTPDLFAFRFSLS